MCGKSKCARMDSKDDSISFISASMVYILLCRDGVAVNAEVKLTCSFVVNSLLSGPPRLPSPLKISSCKRFLYSDGNFHLSSSSWESFFSKHPTM